MFLSISGAWLVFDAYKVRNGCCGHLDVFEKDGFLGLSFGI
jgi:hypothetical protein